MKLYLINLLVLLSQAMNVIFLAGHPDQTVSARAFERQDSFAWGMVYRLINKLFFWQEDHCLNSFLDDLARARQILRSYQ